MIELFSYSHFQAACPMCRYCGCCAVIIIHQLDSLNMNLEISYSTTWVWKFSYCLTWCDDCHLFVFKSIYGTERQVEILWRSMNFHTRRIDVSIPLSMNFSPHSSSENRIWMANCKPSSVHSRCRNQWVGIQFPGKENKIH